MERPLRFLKKSPSSTIWRINIRKILGDFPSDSMFNFCNMRNIIPTLSDDQSWLPASAYTHTTTTGDLSSENMLLLRLREAPKILGASRPLGFYQHKTLTLI